MDKLRVSMMSFTPKGISDRFPFPVGFCGSTWTQAWMEGSISRMRFKHGCNARSRVLREALNHCVSASRRGVSSALLQAAFNRAVAKPVKRKVRRSSVLISKLVTMRTIAKRGELSPHFLRLCLDHGANLNISARLQFRSCRQPSPKRLFNRKPLVCYDLATLHLFSNA